MKSRIILLSKSFLRINFNTVFFFCLVVCNQWDKVVFFVVSLSELLLNLTTFIEA